MSKRLKVVSLVEIVPPLTASVLVNVVAPVTPRVPATVVLPDVSTVNLVPSIVKSFLTSKVP